MTRPDRILVFIPMYNCAPQIPRVLDQLRDPRVAALVSGVVCIDNRSTDGTAEAAARAMESLPVAERTILRNEDNYGLGGSHKVAIDFAAQHGFDYLIVLHGDDQGSIADVAGHLERGTHRTVDFLLGARFMRGSRLVGYSALRTSANVAFNWIFSIVSGKRLYDLGSGLNVFRVTAFADGFHLRFADNLTFNYHLILAIVARRYEIQFFPLTWREDDQVSNAKLSRLGFQILGLLRQRIIAPGRFLEGEHRKISRATYPSRIVKAWRPDGDRATRE